MKSSDIDEDTPSSSRRIRSLHDGKTFDLVMSDEFNKEGRSFEAGADSKWTSLTKPGASSDGEFQFYNGSTKYVTTKKGSLVLITTPDKVTWTDFDAASYSTQETTLNYTSGMLMSWNKFCFTGGILEVSLQLPGPYNSGGLWPAFWLMGNLAKATNQYSNYWMWPWSYDKCSNESKGQMINACDETPGYGLHPHQGRGAPEIDLLEVKPGSWNYAWESDQMEYIDPYLSTSMQISPGLPNNGHRPINGAPFNASLGQQWYTGLYKGDTYESIQDSNYWGGLCGEPGVGNASDEYVEDTLSLITDIGETYFNSYHKYRLEWQPGENGYVEWYLDDHLVFGVPAEALRNTTGAIIPTEPMYLVANVAMSYTWGMPSPCQSSTVDWGVPNCPACGVCYDCRNPDCQCALPEGMKGCGMFPTEMKIDYVRVYQNHQDPKHSVGCSPENFPTSEWIQGHAEWYADWQPIPIPYDYTYHVIIYYFLVYFMPSITLLVAVLYVLKYYEYFEDFCHSQYIRVPSSSQQEQTSFRSFVAKKWLWLKTKLGFGVHSDLYDSNESSSQQKKISKGGDSDLNTGSKNNINSNTIWL